MKDETLGEYISSAYLKSLNAADPKEGKTTALACMALGAFPWQSNGGLVSDPSDLHIITADANAAGGLRAFLINRCKVPEADAKRIRVYNMQDDVRRVCLASSEGYDHSFFNALISTHKLIGSRVAASKGVSAVLMSSLTGVAMAVERGIMGTPTGASDAGKGYGSRDKWKLVQAQLLDIQNMFQIDYWHMLWEAHIDRPPPNPQQTAANAPSASIQISGKTGRLWSVNCEQIWRLRRMNEKYPNSEVDKVYLERGTLDFLVANGRGFDALDLKEPDLVKAAMKLGVKVGGWRPSKTS